MITNRYFLAKPFTAEYMRRGKKFEQALSAGSEVYVLAGDDDGVLCTFERMSDFYPDVSGIRQYRIPYEYIEERIYETRLVETRPMRNTGLFMTVVTEEEC